MKKVGAAIVLCIIFFIGCMAPQNKTQQGAVLGTAGGAAVGAVIGQAISHNTKGTLIGAAIGAAVGGLGGAAIGMMMDNQEKAMREAVSSSDATVTRDGNLLGVILRGDIIFDTNSAVVKTAFYPEINRVANVLKQYPDTLIRVEGHTDNVGREEYNMDLSLRRANAVKALLVQQGVADSRMDIAGFGPKMPIADNSTESGRQMNRRVEIKIAPQA